MRPIAQTTEALEGPVAAGPRILPWPWLACLLLGFQAALIPFSEPASRTMSWLTNLSIVLGSGLAAGLTAGQARAARRRGDLGWGGWALLAAGLTAAWAGNLIWAGLLLLAGREPFPSSADACFVAFYLLTAAALLRLALPAAGRAERARLVLDYLLVVVAAGVGVVELVLRQLQPPGAPVTLATAVAALYPMLDLLLLYACLHLLWQPSALRTASAVRHLVLGAVAGAVADLSFLWVQAQQGTAPDGGLLDWLWQVGFLAFGSAAWQELRAAQRPAVEPVEPPRWLGAARRWVPLVAGLVPLLLLATTIEHTWSSAVFRLGVGATLFYLLLAARQVLVWRHNAALLRRAQLEAAARVTAQDARARQDQLLAAVAGAATALL
ncbi:MAG: hypothetical protein IT204_16075, partial [Fimbriimonadaceae bacterium]|nr:hypothetical protein [Fimbriimonadaceae bacterium]